MRKDFRETEYGLMTMAVATAIDLIYEVLLVKADQYDDDVLRVLWHMAGAFAGEGALKPGYTNKRHREAGIKLGIDSLK